MAVKKGGLGRGFDSLFTDNAVESKPNAELRLSQIVPNRDQPRKVFDDTALRELADSIQKHGLIQPILVRPMDDGSYRIVAGERRWRASRLAGLEKVPVVIKEMSDNEAAELALIENLQREDLNPIEEAEGYRVLMETYSMTQEQVAVRVGKSRPAIANALRLLGLTEAEKEALSKGEITSGHARALLSFPDSEFRRQAFELAKSGASVREIEHLSKQQSVGSTMKKPRIRNKAYVEVEAAIQEQIGRKVKISGNGKSGTLQIEFFNEEDLFDLAKKLTGEK